MHGGAGVTDDFPLAEMFSAIRTLRIADGPDEAHRALIAEDGAEEIHRQGRSFGLSQSLTLLHSTPRKNRKK